VFDVGLLVRFVPFSTLVDWTVGLTSDLIAPPSFNEEQYHFTTDVKNATSIDANKALPLSFSIDSIHAGGAIPNAPKTYEPNKEEVQVAA
jgi:hypothetical protein